MANSTPRKYIFTEGQTRLLFLAMAVGMISTLFAILILSSARPRGEFKQLDRTPYIQTVTEATASISAYSENADGSYSIPIERAMELVVERGVENPFSAE